MFERGDVRAFEYPDGHTFPPGREIPARRRGHPFPIHEVAQRTSFLSRLMIMRPGEPAWTAPLRPNQ